ncbi:hypothetical protein J1N35_038556 [Gossypium stocksii]|uniref:Uncharacterized protein n=1 Tax=Gossypium stocksii TaxID=47602 RepID=A0A9D3UM44_9ROSI|nr:hypothetical protein J1N35_038556 [Gossypium stocksii]
MPDLCLKALYKNLFDSESVADSYAHIRENKLENNLRAVQQKKSLYKNKVSSP